jgi:hypothetical protein
MPAPTPSGSPVPFRPGRPTPPKAVAARPPTDAPAADASADALGLAAAVPPGTAQRRLRPSPRGRPLAPPRLTFLVSVTWVSGSEDCRQVAADFPGQCAALEHYPRSGAPEATPAPPLGPPKRPLSSSMRQGARVRQESGRPGPRPAAPTLGSAHHDDIDEESRGSGAQPPPDEANAQRRRIDEDSSRGAGPWRGPPAATGPRCAAAVGPPSGRSGRRSASRRRGRLRRGRGKTAMVAGAVAKLAPRASLVAVSAR